MIMTVNISLPKSMYEDAKKALAARGYASVSEFIRNTLREELYPRLTENGFTPEFEQMVLEAEKEPIRKDRVWRTEKDINIYFNALRKRIKRHAKNRTNRAI